MLLANARETGRRVLKNEESPTTHDPQKEAGGERSTARHEKSLSECTCEGWTWSVLAAWCGVAWKCWEAAVFDLLLRCFGQPGSCMTDRKDVLTTSPCLS